MLHIISCSDYIYLKKPPEIKNHDNSKYFDLCSILHIHRARHVEESMNILKPHCSNTDMPPILLGCKYNIINSHKHNYTALLTFIIFMLFWHVFCKTFDYKWETHFHYIFSSSVSQYIYDYVCVYLMVNHDQDI